MRIRKLHHPELMKYRVELIILWYSLPLTGFWFESLTNAKS